MLFQEASIVTLPSLSPHHPWNILWGLKPPLDPFQKLCNSNSTVHISLTEGFDISRGWQGPVRQSNWKKWVSLIWISRGAGLGGGGKFRKKSLLWLRYEYFLELHIPVKNYVPFNDCHRWWIMVSFGQKTHIKPWLYRNCLQNKNRHMLTNLFDKKLSSSQTVYLAHLIQETYVLVRFPLFGVPSFNF